MRLLNPSLTVGALIGAPTVREGFPARAQYYAVGALGVRGSGADEYGPSLISQKTWRAFAGGKGIYRQLWPWALSGITFRQRRISSGTRYVAARFGYFAGSFISAAFAPCRLRTLRRCRNLESDATRVVPERPAAIVARRSARRLWFAGVWADQVLTASQARTGTARACLSCSRQAAAGAEKAVPLTYQLKCS